MPVTAKLSRKFYETFGDEIANELVEWFNAVDATYRSDLRELNEQNYARFEARLDQGLAEYNSQRERRMADFRTELRDIKAELVKWTFVFVATATFTVLGVMVALLER